MLFSIHKKILLTILLGFSLLGTGCGGCSGSAGGSSAPGSELPGFENGPVDIPISSAKDIDSDVKDVTFIPDVNESLLPAGASSDDYIGTVTFNSSSGGCSLLAGAYNGDTGSCISSDGIEDHSGDSFDSCYSYAIHENLIGVPLAFAIYQDATEACQDNANTGLYTIVRIDSVPDELGGGYTMTEFASNSSNLQANVRGEIPFGFTGTGDSLKVVFGTRNSANEVIIKTVTLVDKDYDVLNTSEGTTLSANIDRFKMSNDGTKLVAIDEDNNTYYYNGTSISSFSLEGITNDSILDMDEYGRYLTYSRQNESLDTMYVSMRDMQEGSNFDLATDLTTIDADEVTSLVLVNQAAVFLVSHDTGSNYNFIFGDFGTSAAGNGDASFDMFYGSTSNISNAKAFDYSGQTTGAYRCFRSEDGDGNSIFGICMIENTSIIDPPDGYTITSFDTSLERNRFIYAIRPAGDSDNTRSQIFIQEIGEDAAYVGPGWSPLFAKTSVNDADTIAYLQYHSSSSTEYPQVAVKDLGLSSSYSTLAARNTFDTIDFGDSANMWREFSGGCWPRTYSIVDDDRSKGTINAVTGYYVAPGSAASVVIKATDCSGTEVSYQSISVEEGGEGQENGGGDSNDTFIAAYFNGDVDNLSGLYFEADEITNSQIAPLISASSIETISFVYNQTIDQSDFTNKFYYENGTQCTLGEIYQPGGTYGIWNPWVDPVDIALGSGNDEWMNGHDNSVTADAITIDGNTYTIDITKAFQSRANGAVDAYEGVNGILSPDDDYTEIVEWTGTGDNRCIRFGQYILGADDLYFQFNDTDL